MEMVGFVGLGTIGGAIARNIRKAGYPMMVHDIVPETALPLVEGGARPAASPVGVARHCPVVFTSLPGPREVREVALGPDGLLQGVGGGSIYVDLSSSRPDLIRSIEAEFRTRGARVMDAPLIVGKDGVANRSLQVLASGALETYERVKSLLGTFGDTVVYTGELGSGTVIKLAHNLVRRGIGLAIGEGIVLGAKAGVDPQMLWDCMRWGLEVQLHQLAKTFSETVFKGNYDAPASFDIACHEKTLGLRRSLAASTTCLCPSRLWWSSSWCELSVGGGPRKAPHPSFGFRKKPPVLRYADNRSNNSLAWWTGEKIDRCFRMRCSLFPNHFFLREVSMKMPSRLALYIILLGLLAILPGGKAFAQADFYKGKTIKIIRGGGPGGSGEFQTRALVRFLEKYIPGKPNLMVEFIEGAAGRKAANVIFSSTRPDGLTIGSIGAGLVVGPILGLPGSNYDLDKFIYLGSTDAGDPYIFYTKGDLGLDTLDKVRAKSGLRLGAHAVGHPVYVTARIAAYLLGLKDPKFVTGYTGPEIYIALTRGELDAHATGAARFVVEQPEWIEKKLVHFHATLTVPKGRHHPAFARVPEFESFTKSETERKLLDMFRAFQYPRWPYIFPPGTPKERVQIIREAMRKTFADPEFPKEFHKLMGDDPAPLGGEELERAIKELPRDQEVVQLYQKLAGGDPLPTR